MKNDKELTKIAFLIAERKFPDWSKITGGIQRINYHGKRDIIYGTISVRLKRKKKGQTFTYILDGKDSYILEDLVDLDIYDLWKNGAEHWDIKILWNGQNKNKDKR